MPEDYTPEDKQKILALMDATKERADAWALSVEKRRLQRRLAVDLVQREVISQARASKLADVERQTLRSWLDAAFEGREMTDRW